jgi:hypothetical protein
MSMLSMLISSRGIRSVHASVPDTHAQCMRQFLTLMLSIRVKTDALLRVRISSWHPSSVHDQFLRHILRVRISSWRLCSACFEWAALSARISSWRVCSVHAPVSDSYFQRMHQFLTCLLSICIRYWCTCSVHAAVPYLHAKGIQNEHLKIGKLMRTLSMRIRNWCLWSGCISVPDRNA